MRESLEIIINIYRMKTKTLQTVDLDTTTPGILFQTKLPIWTGANLRHHNSYCSAHQFKSPERVLWIVLRILSLKDGIHTVWPPPGTSLPAGILFLPTVRMGKSCKVWCQHHHSQIWHCATFSQVWEADFCPLFSGGLMFECCGECWEYWGSPPDHMTVDGCVMAPLGARSHTNFLSECEQYCSSPPLHTTTPSDLNK